LRVIELAVSTVHQPYVYSGSSVGGNAYRDKDMAEIMKRAERMLQWALDENVETTSTLVEKLRGVLCGDK